LKKQDKKDEKITIRDVKKNERRKRLCKRRKDKYAKKIYLKLITKSARKSKIKKKKMKD